jgi:hypothetical protein
MATKPLTHAEIIRLFGTIDDHKAAEIIALNPSPAELDVTESYLAGMTDVMGKERIPLTGKAAEIFDIVMRDEPYEDDDYRWG